MTEPKIKVGADVGGVTAGIQQVGQAAEKANKAAERSLIGARKALQGYTGDIEKARRAFEALQKSGARGTRNLRGKSFDDYTGGGWQDHSVNSAEAARLHRDVMRRVGLTPTGGPGGQSALGFGGHSLFTAGRAIMNSAFPVGGPGATIMHSGYQAAQNSPGGVASGGGMARLAMGGGIGLAAFGAVKGIRSIAGKVGAAEDESSNYADLVRQVGATATEFGTLRDSVRSATSGLGIAYNEAAKLAATYAHESGRTGPGFAGEVGTAARFSRGLGLDPEAGVRFFGSMRHHGVSGGDKDNKKLAQQIGDAVATKGEFSRAGELIDAVNHFVVTVASRSMGVANVGGFLAATTRLGSLGLPGLGLSESAGLAGRLDAGMRNPGGGEAADNMLLSMLQRKSGGVANAYDLAAVKAGGMFSTGADVFGQKSPQYLAAKARGDKAEMARLDKMAGSFGSTTMGDQAYGDLLGHYGQNTQAAISAGSTFFGISATESAAQMASFLTPGGQGKKLNPLAAAVELSEGDKTRNTIAGLGNVFQNFADKALPLLTAIRDFAMRIGEKFGAIPEGSLDRLRAEEEHANRPPSQGGAGGSWDAPDAVVPTTGSARQARGSFFSESAARKMAAFTAAEQSKIDAYERSPGNLAELRQAVMDEKRPTERAILQRELDKQVALAGDAKVADGAAPRGGAAGGAANHQTATVYLKYKDGAQAAPPLPLSFGGAPQPAGARRGM